MIVLTHRYNIQLDAFHDLILGQVLSLWQFSGLTQGLVTTPRRSLRNAKRGEKQRTTGRVTSPSHELTQQKRKPVKKRPTPAIPPKSDLTEAAPFHPLSRLAAVLVPLLPDILVARDHQATLGALRLTSKSAYAICTPAFFSRYRYRGRVSARAFNVDRSYGCLPDLSNVATASLLDDGLKDPNFFNWHGHVLRRMFNLLFVRTLIYDELPLGGCQGLLETVRGFGIHNVLAYVTSISISSKALKSLFWLYDIEGEDPNKGFLRGLCQVDKLASWIGRPFAFPSAVIRHNLKSVNCLCIHLPGEETMNRWGSEKPHFFFYLRRSLPRVRTLTFHGCDAYRFPFDEALLQGRRDTNILAFRSTRLPSSDADSATPADRNTFWRSWEMPWDKVAFGKTEQEGERWPCTLGRLCDAVAERSQFERLMRSLFERLDPRPPAKLVLLNAHRCVMEPHMLAAIPSFDIKRDTFMDYWPNESVARLIRALFRLTKEQAGPEPEFVSFAGDSLCSVCRSESGLRMDYLTHPEIL